MSITHIWIEPGCIECRWCHDLAPEVFIIGNGTSHIRGDALVKPITGLNECRIALKTQLTGQMAEFIEFVASGCPTSVIKLEVVEPADELG